MSDSVYRSLLKLGVPASLPPSPSTTVPAAGTGTIPPMPPIPPPFSPGAGPVVPPRPAAAPAPAASSVTIRDAFADPDKFREYWDTHPSERAGIAAMAGVPPGTGSADTYKEIAKRLAPPASTSTPAAGTGTTPPAAGTGTTTPAAGTDKPWSEEPPKPKGEDSSWSFDKITKWLSETGGNVGSTLLGALFPFLQKLIGGGDQKGGGYKQQPDYSPSEGPFRRWQPGQGRGGGSSGGYGGKNPYSMFYDPNDTGSSLIPLYEGVSGRPESTSDFHMPTMQEEFEANEKNDRERAIRDRRNAEVKGNNSLKPQVYTDADGKEQTYYPVGSVPSARFEGNTISGDPVTAPGTVSAGDTRVTQIGAQNNLDNALRRIHSLQAGAIGSLGMPVPGLGGDEAVETGRTEKLKERTTEEAAKEEADKKRREEIWATDLRLGRAMDEDAADPPPFAAFPSGSSPSAAPRPAPPAASPAAPLRTPSPTTLVPPPPAPASPKPSGAKSSKLPEFKDFSPLKGEPEKVALANGRVSCLLKVAAEKAPVVPFSSLNQKLKDAGYPPEFLEDALTKARETGEGFAEKFFQFFNEGISPAFPTGFGNLPGALFYTGDRPLGEKKPAGTKSPPPAAAPVKPSRLPWFERSSLEKAPEKTALANDRVASLLKIAPYKSESQRKYMHWAKSKGKLEGVNLKEWDEASKGEKLPDRVKKADDPMAAQPAPQQGPEAVPELLPLSAYPGDLALLAKRYLDKVPDQAVEDIALRLYLHDLMSSPQVQNDPQRAMMVVQGHLEEMSPKKAPQAAAPKTASVNMPLLGELMRSVAGGIGMNIGAMYKGGGDPWMAGSPSDPTPPDRTPLILREAKTISELYNQLPNLHLDPIPAGPEDAARARPNRGGMVRPNSAEAFPTTIRRPGGAEMKPDEWNKMVVGLNSGPVLGGNK